MSIKAVLFDLGGTLIGNVLGTFETFQTILEREGIHVSVTDLEEAFIKAEKEMGDQIDQLMGRIPLSEFYAIWDSHVLKALEIEDDGNLARKVDEEWMDVCGVIVYPDTLPAVTMLKRKGILTGIISNAYEEEIYQILEEVNVDSNLFDVVTGVDTVKKRKPNPEIFVYAVEKLTIRPEEALYVGNNVENDYRAPEKVGLIPLLIVRSRDAVPEIERYITNLMSVAEYLDR